MPLELQADSYSPQSGVTDAWDVNPGIAILPVALTQEELDSGVSPVVVVRLHSPYRMKRVTFNFQKANTPPIVPAPTDSGTFTFIGGSLTFPFPSHNTTLTGRTWTVAGDYLFVENAPGDVLNGDGFVNTSPPWWTFDQTARMTAGYYAAAAAIGAAQGAGNTIGSAGLAAQCGYGAALATDLTNPNYDYSEPVYYPTIFLNDTLVKGGPGLTDTPIGP
jgi:hypothetical protein